MADHTHRAEPVIRSALPSDKSALANLIHFEPHVHRHLDYRPPLDWIGRDPFLIQCEQQRIRAALACPNDPPQVAWIRLFAASNQASLFESWAALWEAARFFLQEKETLHITAIPIFGWFEAILKQSNFSSICRIVMLQQDADNLPEQKPRSDVRIRPMTAADLDEVHQVDQSAFSPIWVNTLEHIEATFKKAVAATVVEDHAKITGFQISTYTAMGCHLARLAIRPGFQESGLGYALLYDLMVQMKHHSGRTITVNTQKDNLASLALYRKAGFKFTGEEYPVYRYRS